MKLLDSSVKFITVTKVCEELKKFSTGSDYTKYFLDTTIDLESFRSKSLFTQQTIEISITLNQFKYGNKNILFILRNILSLIEWN